MIWAALLVGLLAVSTYSYLVPSEDGRSAARLALVLVDAVLLLTVVPVTFLVRAMLFRRSRTDAGLRPVTWQRGDLVFWSGCMVVGMFSAQVATTSGTAWPSILIGAVAFVLLAATFPAATQLSPRPAGARRITGYWRPASAGIAVVTVAAFCGWEVIKPPAEWATHPPPEAVATQPSQFLPPEDWKPAYLERLRTVVAGREGVDIKVYGMQRGIPRDDGWVTVTSTGAGFSIAMPGPSLDQRMSSHATDGVAVAVDALEHDGGGLKLRAICTRRADGDLKGGIESLLKPYRAHPEKVTIHEVIMQGRKVYEVRAPSKLGLMRVRFCAGAGTTWVWGAEYAATNETAVATDVDRFLDSFRFPAKP
jgi:hypothetical protein